MFLVGIGPDDNDEKTVASIFKKTLKNVRHHYLLVDMINIPFNIRAGEVKPFILRLYGDENYITSKKLFSQDGRPPKIVRTNPWLVVNCTTAGKDVINRLREDKIPAEGFLIQTTPGWEKETLGMALGDNYRVSISDIVQTLLDVYQQKRLDFADSIRDQRVLRRHLDKLAKLQHDEKDIAGMGVTDNFVATLGLPVWFREKIPYKRPYRA